MPLNPSDRNCWETCSSCRRCSNKGLHAKCSSCSGRHDPDGRFDSYDIDDKCRCREGIFQFRTSKGHFVQVKLNRNPFGGEVKFEGNTPEEQEWNRYVREQRERLDNENWDPVVYDDGTSTTDWYRKKKDKGS